MRKRPVYCYFNTDYTCCHENCLSVYGVHVGPTEYMRSTMSQLQVVLPGTVPGAARPASRSYSAVGGIHEGPNTTS